MPNIISISVDGKKYSGWTEATITTSMETLTSSFQLKVVDKINQDDNSVWPLQTQDECSIYIDNEKIITGYIDDVTVEIAGDYFLIINVYATFILSL